MLVYGIGKIAIAWSMIDKYLEGALKRIGRYSMTIKKEGFTNEKEICQFDYRYCSTGVDVCCHNGKGG